MASVCSAYKSNAVKYNLTLLTTRSKHYTCSLSCCFVLLCTVSLIALWCIFSIATKHCIVSPSLFSQITLLSAVWVLSGSGCYGQSSSNGPHSLIISCGQHGGILLHGQSWLFVGPKHFPPWVLPHNWALRIWSHKFWCPASLLQHLILWMKLLWPLHRLSTRFYHAFSPVFNPPQPQFCPYLAWLPAFHHVGSSNRFLNIWGYLLDLFFYWFTQAQPHHKVG